MAAPKRFWKQAAAADDDACRCARTPAAAAALRCATRTRHADTGTRTRLTRRQTNALIKEWSVVMSDASSDKSEIEIYLQKKCL